ncbi:hypothetical protein Vafri_5794 [Volvox africanus]|nr:hypothetical protein Vafri_5794 [Volvox africanus]
MQAEEHETRIQELQDQLQQYGAHYPQQQTSERGGTAPMGATGGALPPAGPLPEKRGAPPPPPQSQLVLPPVLHLDPAQLLVEADLDVGLTRADIQTELHQFASAVSWLCRQGMVQDVARSLAVFSMNAAIPEGSVVALPSMDDMVAAERPACLAHLLMFWMSNNVWAEPLKYVFGCNSLRLLETLLPAAGGAAEQNFHTLLRSHAARQWLHTMRGVLNEAFDADSKGDWQGWHVRLVSRNVQQQDRATRTALSVLKAMTEELAGWLRNCPRFANAVRNDPPFHLLLLRAFKLGLTVLAAHPLLRLYITVPRSEDRERRWIPVNLRTQEAGRKVLFVPKELIKLKQNGNNGIFVLCSLQPGVRYDDSQVAMPAGSTVPVRNYAAAVNCSGSREVLLKEEVVTWEWSYNAKG